MVISYLFSIKFDFSVYHSSQMAGFGPYQHVVTSWFPLSFNNFDRFALLFQKCDNAPSMK